MKDINKRLSALSPEKRDQLLKQLKKLGNTTTTSGSIEHSRENRELPLSFAQERMWFLNQLEPESATYNIPVAFLIKGELDVQAFSKSLNEIIKRHEVLRTTFARPNGQPIPVVTPFSWLEIPVENLEEFSTAQRNERAFQIAEEEAKHPFNLAQESLLRFRLLRLQAQNFMFVLTMHHIVSDGWSMDIFMRELTTLYEAFSHGKPSPLPPLPIQYTDFAAWQHNWLQSEDFMAQIAYWRQHLQNDLPILHLSTDRPRPAMQSYRGAIHKFVVSTSHTNELKSLCLQEGVTLFMFLLAVYQTFLYRYTGQEDIVVGSPIANRKSRETEYLIGFFVNTLILRTQLSGDLPFTEMLQRVREVTLEAYTNQDVPFEKLVEELHPERNLSNHPLFQTMLVLQKNQQKMLQISDFALEPVQVHTDTSKFDLSLFVWEEEKELTAAFEYNSDLFNPETIQRFALHFHGLLESVLRSPDQKLAQIPLMSRSEQQHMLALWNTTYEPAPPDQSFLRVFERQVEHTPEAIAVVFEENTLSYQELNKRANKLAHYLQKLGVGPEKLVGICTERSLEMIVGLLGILKAGGAYIPIDPAFPSERQAFMLEDSNAPVLLTQQKLLCQLPERDCTCLCLDSDWHLLAEEPDSNFISALVDTNLAYIIYTSGSTGNPKGVQVTHHSLYNFLLSMQKSLTLTEHDIFLAVTTFSFDIAALELYLPLLSGAKLLITGRKSVIDGELLAQSLVENRVTFLQATPSTWRLLLEAEWQGNQQLTMLCGGETLPPDLAKRLLIKGKALWNLYGPTETTIWSSAIKISQLDQHISIGRPLANTQLYILDPYLQLQPIGAPGELYIGGEGLARGYLHRPELTAERFLPDPFNSQAGSRFYRTGDRACYLADGTIEHLGRFDTQIKLRGFRIELEEIERVLERLDTVRAAAVIISGEAEETKELVAYIVPQSGSTYMRENIQNMLRSILPEYMIPTTLVIIDTLPLTPNRKLDRKALPKPEHMRGHDKVYVPPRDALEFQLVQIWEDILDKHPIGVTENFFDLGGHSFLAMRLINQIRKQFGPHLPLSVLFEKKTIEQFACILRQKQKASQGSCLVAIQPYGNNLPFFCVHPAGGNVLCYMKLAEYLGPNQPFYGLQAAEVYGQKVAAASIQDMATRYIQAIQAVFPHGPFQLGGWSIGGAIAFEMAVQLQKKGIPIQLLALIDTPSVWKDDEPLDDSYLLMWAMRDVLQRTNKEQEKTFEHLWDTELSALSREQKLDRYYHLAKAAHMIPPEIELEDIQNDLQLYRTNIQAVQRYTPSTPYQGNITLFKASDVEESQNRTRVEEWQNFSSQPLQIYTIPGTHRMLVEEPFVQTLAEKLSSCMSIIDIERG